eukprot:CAMPEP_0113316506 /NCGR_PEP_ID=MMETSP0010_2-20120614/11759_1 /TAXON_ID=216773 ORGANISM="Corethron hystrix, Strain 308" /NCGR_SAMPLE_ID=MMETSP0010_2 /ASSEMBLY_ACC=CAM_ASM_000155 /LENGTH=501 /DNA_ID=CAMNT_0000173245 /DNA_START=233 /DNA_END=1738 /DNA_ORIENTATION=- /assembly_acc=CAM_ASM_000155
MTHILSYLPLDSLSLFSCTAVRPNIDVYRYLKLQMEFAILDGCNISTESHGSHLYATLPGISLLRRLSALDPEAAQDLLQEFVTHRPRGDNGNLAQIASAVFTMLGAARYVSESDHQLEMMAMFSMGMAGMIFRRAVNEQQKRRSREGIIDSNEGIAAPIFPLFSLPNISFPHLPSMNLPKRGESVFPHVVLSRIVQGVAFCATNMTQQRTTITSHDDDGKILADKYEATTATDAPPTYTPVGPAGVYCRTTQRCTDILSQAIQSHRNRRLNFLSEPERFDITADFLEACSTDDIDAVRDIVTEGIDIDGFFSRGPDEFPGTCGLHAAASTGSDRVLEYLCRGVGASEKEDGGMADVNVKDDNGWTACHYAAGRNGVESIKILARSGARLNVEAGNGYTPYHWAEKLSQKEAAEELRNFGADDRFMLMGRGMFGYWGHNEGHQTHRPLIQNEAGRVENNVGGDGDLNVGGLGMVEQQRPQIFNNVPQVLTRPFGARILTNG